MRNLNAIRQKLSMNIFATIKTFITLSLFLIATDLCGQSFVIGEPQGILDKIITHYKQTEQVEDSALINVGIMQGWDTTLFCIGNFKEASHVFSCLPSAIYKNGENYVFVKTGYEKYFCYNEDYVKFIYSLAAKFTRLNIKIKSYSPFVMEYTDEVMSTGPTEGYIWYYVVQDIVVKTIIPSRSIYSYCQYCVN